MSEHPIIGNVTLPAASYNALIAERDRLRAALEEIKNHEACVYGGDGSQYSVGVTDGHRAASNIARAALEAK